MTGEQLKEFIKTNWEPGQKIIAVLVVPKGNGVGMYRINQGFSPSELMGTFFEVQLDIMAQIRGFENPTVETYRTFLQPEAEEQGE